MPPIRLFSPHRGPSPPRGARAGLAALALAGLLAGVTPCPQARAQTVISAEDLAREAEVKRAQRAERDAELKAIEERLARNSAARARIDAEIGEIRADRARLNTTLIETTRRLQAAEARADAVETRLAQLVASQQAVRRSLEARRDLIGDVLAALQRMGRKPPPAVLVRPEDVLAAVRASILMGAVLPELRGEAEALAADLGELVKLAERIEGERQQIQKDYAELAGERQRLAALVEARRAREAEAQAGAEGEQRAVTALTRDAQGLRELVGRLDRDILGVVRLQDEARRAAEAQGRETRERMAALALRDPSRLGPQAPFQDMRGLLPQPAAGSQLRGFGAPDGGGGQARGVSLVTRPGAVVSSPADGHVAFAGPLRGFGTLVILQVGGGYHVLLAGLARADVARPQFVLAGEPLGVMGERQEGSVVSLGDGNGQPILYVEFRKDGQSIDPGPWWAKTGSDRVRG
jgi:septal ring factor EnvC (AmiA/AmiB activator)